MVCITFRRDTRGHVPFAVIGVVLVMLAVVATAATGTTPAVDHQSAVAVDQTTAVLETTLTEATQAAGAEAAANPVLEPDGFGNVLNESRPYRSYLELLVYVHLQTRLEGTSVAAGEYSGSVSLSPVTDQASAAAAIDRTTVTETEPGQVEVTVENCTLTVKTGETAVRTETVSPTVTVETPAITLHERMQEFEDRLTRSPLEGPGLGRALSTRLYPMAWARGYAQYGGAPVADVIAPRHIELATAGALIEQQTAAFGTTDPRSQPALKNGTAQAAAADLVPADLNEYATELLADPVSTAEPTREDIDGEASVTVGSSADQAAMKLTQGEETIEDILEQAYELDVRIDTATNRMAKKNIQSASQPGPAWEPIETEETVTVEAAEVPPNSAPMPELPTVTDYEPVGSTHRVLTLKRTVTQTWQNGANKTTTTRAYREEHAVSIGVYAAPVAIPELPQRPIETLGDQDTVEQAVAAAGGIETIGTEAIDTPGYSTTVRIEEEPPPAAVTAAYEELAAIRETTRTVSTTIDHEATLTGTPPQAQLRETIETRMQEETDVPRRYDNRSHRGQVAVRMAYLEALSATLAVEEDLTARLQQTLTDELAARIDVPTQQVTAAIETAGTQQPADTQPPLEENVSVEVDPPYPSRSAVRTPGPRTDATTHTPIGIRMTTVAAPPVDRLTDPVLERLFVTDELSLPVAARILGGTETLPEDALTAEQTAVRSDLEQAVEAELATVTESAATTLARDTSLSEPEAKQAIEAGLNEWGSPAKRIRAIEQNAAPEAIVAATDLPRQDKHTVYSAVTVAFEEALSEATVAIPSDEVQLLLEGQQAILKEKTEALAEDGVETTLEKLDDRIGGSLSMVPAGVPLLPKPGLWWTTVNAWTVEVEGELPAVALRTPSGSPRGAGTVTYTRAEGTVARDLTGNGTEETLGDTPPVELATWSVIVVAVPPGGGGVGNTDSDAVTCSAGWEGACLRP